MRFTPYAVAIATTMTAAAGRRRVASIRELPRARSGILEGELFQVLGALVGEGLAPGVCAHLRVFHLAEFHPGVAVLDPGDFGAAHAFGFHRALRGEAVFVGF